MTALYEAGDDLIFILPACACDRKEAGVRASIVCGTPILARMTTKAVK